MTYTDSQPVIAIMPTKKASQYLYVVGLILFHPTFLRQKAVKLRLSRFIFSRASISYFFLWGKKNPKKTSVLFPFINSVAFVPDFLSVYLTLLCTHLHYGWWLIGRLMTCEWSMSSQGTHGRAALSACAWTEFPPHRLTFSRNASFTLVFRPMKAKRTVTQLCFSREWKEISERCQQACGTPRVLRRWKGRGWS